MSAVALESSRSAETNSHAPSAPPNSSSPKRSCARKSALVLGSGLGAFADEFAGATRIPYSKIPGFPRSTVEGHAGRLVIGKVGDVAVAAMQGRVHFYEGYSPKEVFFRCAFSGGLEFAPRS